MTEVTAGASGTKMPEQRADGRADGRDVEGRNADGRDDGRGSRAGDRSGRGPVDERGELREAARQIAAAEGVGIEDIVLVNDRPVPVVAEQVMTWLGWT